MKRQHEEKKEEAPSVLQETDLRSITRHSDRMTCIVTMDLGYDREGRSQRLTWLQAGEAQIRRLNRDEGTWWLAAHLADNACDEEHDTAWAFRLPLIGLSLAELVVEYSKTHFVAWVDPNQSMDDRRGRSDFHVPRPGYNPMKHKDAEICDGIYNEKKHKYCKWNDKKKHAIVPSGFYVPPFDPELYEAVRGKKVTIVLGAVSPDEE